MVKAVVGANWGDEGKGKITDMLAEKADIIVCFQGGANAGHTIVNNYGKFALHTLPSGVFYDHTTSIIGNGVALNIPVLFNEIKSITDRDVPMPKILVSDRAQIVMPYHILFDQYEEERLGGKSFGSTKSGIAPFYSDKYAKIGFQVSELFDDELLKENNLKTAQSVRNMLNELPAYLAQRIYDRFNGSCSPFEKVWIYKSWDTVFEKAIVDDIYLKMDIWCYEERYDVVFWTPTPEVEESVFNSCVAKIHSLKQFSPKCDARNQIVRHFAFTEEAALFDFIQELLTELNTIIYNSKE